jgi:hypothetical protein
MAEAPYLVALALLEIGGKRALPLAGRSLKASDAEAPDPGDRGRTLALELLLRLLACRSASSCSSRRSGRSARRAPSNTSARGRSPTSAQRAWAACPSACRRAGPSIPACRANSSKEASRCSNGRSMAWAPVGAASRWVSHRLLLRCLPGASRWGVRPGPARRRAPRLGFRRQHHPPLGSSPPRWRTARAFCGRCRHHRPRLDS